MYTHLHVCIYIIVGTYPVFIIPRIFIVRLIFYQYVICTFYIDMTVADYLCFNVECPELKHSEVRCLQIIKISSVGRHLF